MIRLFLDSSVLFSAAYSAKGHSRDLLIMAAREEITIVTSKLVIEEVRRNLESYSKEAALYFDLITASIPFSFVRPTKRQVLVAARYVAFKDAPIAAAARKAKVDLLVTLDKKHLLHNPEVSKFCRMPVVTPKDAVEFILNKN